MSNRSLIELVLNAYHHGAFPMAQGANAKEFSFFEPVQRGLLPIKNLHIPKRLLRTVKRQPFDVRIDTAFDAVMAGCAKTKKGRKSTWINASIRNVFNELHHMGLAHSVECWHNDGLVGGLYGLELGSIFCGESMFSDMTDASKVSLVHLCARLDMGGFSTLDAQFHNPHLEQFGLYEIPQKEYLEILQNGINKKADFILEGKLENNILENYLSNRKFYPAP